MADNKQTHPAPEGQLLLRTVAMPRDTNPNQDIFGGWIMSQMDLGGGILAAEIAQGRIVTVAVQEMNFIRPVKVGNVVCCYGHCVRVGNTSLQLKIEVWGEDFDERYGNGRPPTGHRSRVHLRRHRCTRQSAPYSSRRQCKAGSFVSLKIKTRSSETSTFRRPFLIQKQNVIIIL